jgi:hypothetical protein
MSYCPHFCDIFNFCKLTMNLNSLVYKVNLPKTPLHILIYARLQKKTITQHRLKRYFSQKLVSVSHIDVNLPLKVSLLPHNRAFCDISIFYTNIFQS